MHITPSLSFYFADVAAILCFIKSLSCIGAWLHCVCFIKSLTCIGAYHHPIIITIVVIIIITATYDRIISSSIRFVLILPMYLPWALLC